MIVLIAIGTATIAVTTLVGIGWATRNYARLDDDRP